MRFYGIKMGTNGKPLGTWKTNENIVNK